MSNVVDIRSFRGETWGALVNVAAGADGEPTATLGSFWGTDGKEVPARCFAFAAALDALATQLRETAVMCGGEAAAAGRPTNPPTNH